MKKGIDVQISPSRPIQIIRIPMYGAEAAKAKKPEPTRQQRFGVFSPWPKKEKRIVDHRRSPLKVLQWG